MAHAPHAKRNSESQSQPQSNKASEQLFSDNRESTANSIPVQAMMANSPQQQQLKFTAQFMANRPVEKTPGFSAKDSSLKAEAVQQKEETILQGEFESEPVQREIATEAPRPNNTGLPDNLKSGIENLSGISMDHVRVHYNSDKPAQLHAHAYAQGSEIHVAPGQEQHLPHEAWHVVQQAQGRVRPTMQMKMGVPVNDDQGLEQEADLMGGKAASLGADNSVQLIVDKGLGVPAGVSQRMVAVAGGQNTFNKKDFTQLAHLDWAMKISGAPLVDLDASISAIGQADDLHLVQHGGKGEMVHQIKDTRQWQSIGAAQIAQLFIAHLPQDYSGTIRVSSCYSGTLTDISDQDSSLVGQIKALIQSSQRDDLKAVNIVGWNGPTITNINLESESGTGAETVNDQYVDLAGKLQDQLLGGKYKALKAQWEQKVGKDVRPLDELAAAASKEFSAFYQEFTDECKKNGFLLDYVESLVIA